MAPDPKPPGRKRGRPANTSKPAVASASQDRPDEYEADAEETARPKQRGRPKKQPEAEENVPEEAVVPEVRPRRKRGRPSLEDKNAESNTAEDAAQPKRRRGQPLLEKKQDDSGAEQGAVEDAGRWKRKKKTKVTDEQPEERPEEQPNGSIGPRRSRKLAQKEPEPREAEPNQEPRSRKGRKPAQQPEQPEPEEAEPAPRSKRQRKAPEPEPEEHIPRTSPPNSLQDLGPGDAHNKGRKAEASKKKGRVPEETADAEDQQGDEPTKKRSRKKGGRPSAEKPNEPRQEEQDANKKQKKRQSKDDAPSDSDEPLPSPPKPYLHIAPFTRTIRSSTIAAKWTPLTGSSLPAATSILSLAHRPILQRTSTTRNRRTYASAALNLVTRRIERKLARGLPFPPAQSSTRRGGADADGGRAMELDFEAVLDGKTALERQLVPGMHAVELLRAERDRMEKELDADYEELRKLEANARAQTRERKDLFRKAHVLAPTSQPESKEEEASIITDSRGAGSLRDLVDTPLEPLALQLAGHADSIRGNLQQAEGVAPQLNRTKAALKDVLQRYLDGGAYEQVVLG
ncbi:hypothetical protein F66182_8793 [Fusarium sp. NRRL 66182]|nr:hypothetical protein F66182_8793 [Fusarium sp. NRRL 66182]